VTDVDEFTNHIRRIVHEVMGRSQLKSTLVCTAYNPKIHAVKGIIQPHGIESGWVPVAALHVGNGFGILVGPRVGSAEKLDGQVFDLHQDGGDPDVMVAHHRQFSTPETPPQVQSGEMLLQHESGNKVFFAADKSVTVIGQSGSQTKHHADGRISMKPATGKNAYYGGDPEQGGNFDLVKTVNGTAQNVMAKIG